MSQQRKFTHDGVYLHRFMWWYPWGVTKWWCPRAFLSGDEWCNIPVCINAPPLGCFIFFRPFGRLRRLPCMSEWNVMTQEEQADYAPCGWLRGGRIDESAHHHSTMESLCPEAWQWLLGGESDREHSLERRCTSACCRSG